MNRDELITGVVVGIGIGWLIWHRRRRRYYGQGLSVAGGGAPAIARAGGGGCCDECGDKRAAILASLPGPGNYAQSSGPTAQGGSLSAVASFAAGAPVPTYGGDSYIDPVAESEPRGIFPLAESGGDLYVYGAGNPGFGDFGRGGL